MILWLGAHSTVRMHDNALAHARMEIAGGSAVVQVVDLTPDTDVTLLSHTWQIMPSPHSLYRIDSDRLGLTVLEGEAAVIRGKEKLSVERTPPAESGYWRDRRSTRESAGRSRPVVVHPSRGDCGRESQRHDTNRRASAKTAPPLVETSIPQRSYSIPGTNSITPKDI